MWLLCAFGSALFAGLTSVLAKCGIKRTDSDIATAIRTGVVLVFSWVMVLISGSAAQITQISASTWLFLTLSGLSTGASWLCYFKALQLGDVNKVVPVDKSSTILTILLAFAILGEELTPIKGAAVVLIGAGTYLMIQKKQTDEQKPHSRSWLLFAVLSAVFASLTSILGKIGIEGVESNLGTALRTGVVLIMAWLVVLVKARARKNGADGAHRLRDIPRSELGFICLSGLATGASWLCYYRALKDGPASVVVPIDKLSILITVAFSFIFFKEKLTKKALAGLALITAGTLVMLIPTITA